MTPQDVLIDWSARPFRYGQDCCQFVGAMVEAIVGCNPVTPFSYQGEYGARRLIAEYGSLEKLVATHVADEIPPESARDGDIVVCDQTDGSQILGVVYRGQIALKTPEGVTSWALGSARRAWSCRKR